MPAGQVDALIKISKLIPSSFSESAGPAAMNFNAARRSINHAGWQAPSLAWYCPDHSYHRPEFESRLQRRTAGPTASDPGVVTISRPGPSSLALVILPIIYDQLRMLVLYP